MWNLYVNSKHALICFQFERQRERGEWKKSIKKENNESYVCFFIQFLNKFAFSFLYFLSYTRLISFRWLIAEIFIHKLVKVTKTFVFVIFSFLFALKSFQFCTSLYDCKFLRKQAWKLSYEQVLSEIPDSTTESFIARLTWVLKPFCC